MRLKPPGSFGSTSVVSSDLCAPLCHFLSLGLGTFRIPSQPSTLALSTGQIFSFIQTKPSTFCATLSSSLSFLPGLQHLTYFLFPLQVLLFPAVSRNSHFSLPYKHSPLSFLTVTQLRLWDRDYQSQGPPSALLEAQCSTGHFNSPWSLTQTAISNL